MPIDDQWKLMMPDSAGNPLLYDTRPGALDGIGPLPTDKNSVPAPGGMGHYTKRKWSFERRARHEQRKQLE